MIFLANSKQSVLEGSSDMPNAFNLLDEICPEMQAETNTSLIQIYLFTSSVRLRIVFPLVCSIPTH